MPVRLPFDLIPRDFLPQYARRNALASRRFRNHRDKFYVGGLQIDCGAAAQHRFGGLAEAAIGIMQKQPRQQPRRAF